MKKILLLAVLSIGIPMTGFFTHTSTAQADMQTVIQKESNTERRIGKPRTGRPSQVDNSNTGTPPKVDNSTEPSVVVEGNNNDTSNCCQSSPKDTQTSKEISASDSKPNSNPCALVRCAGPGYQK